MKKFCVSFVLALLAASAQAADIYKIDSNHASITWFASHFGFSSPSGKFSDVEGVISLDEQNPQSSTVEVTIKTSSLITGISKFDEHLKSKDFLNVSNFPTAKFVSTAVSPNGRGSAKVEGNLTLLGVTKNISLDVHLNKIGLNPINQKKTAGFTISTVLKRSDFGMSFGLPNISNNVKIAIELEANLISSSAENSIGDWKILPQASKIEFTAEQANAAISGSFKKFDGKISFDPNHLDQSKVEIEVDTTSVEASFVEALETMRQATWLATKTFPQAKLKVEKFVAIAGKNNFRGKGDLTIKGKTLPVIFDFNLAEYTKTRAVAKGSFAIKRSAFGVGSRNLSQANGVQDDVLVSFEIAAEK